MKSIDTPLIGTVYLVEPNVPPQRRELDLTNIARTGMNLVVLWPPVSRWDSNDGVSIASELDGLALEDQIRRYAGHHKRPGRQAGHTRVKKADHHGWIEHSRPENR
jgi:hypothetical protein